MSSSDPSIHCDCRQKSIRNVRIITAIVFAASCIVRPAAFTLGSIGHLVCSLLIGLALVVYGIATMFDETATFPKPLYGLMAVLGAVLAAIGISHF